MCVNYRPPDAWQLQATTGAAADGLTWPAETWKDYLAPIVTRSAAGLRTAVLASYGLVPRRHIPPQVRPWDTMNARAETLDERRSFAGAWRAGQRCLVPLLGFYEPN